MSAEQGTKASEPDRLEEAAQWWVTLLEGELHPELEEAWERWKAMPDNWTAFQEISKLARELKVVGRPPIPTQAALDGDRYTGSVSVSTWLESSPIEENHGRSAAIVRRAVDYQYRR